MHTISIFECFAGIGSPFMGLKQACPELDIQHKGISEWQSDAIISFALVHYKEAFEAEYQKVEQETKENLKKELQEGTFSSNGKTQSEFKRVAEKKLKSLIAANRVCKNMGAIQDIKSFPDDLSILVYSFPCQSISSQGTQKGFEKDSSTPSAMVWKVGEAIQNTQNKPKVLIMENVKAITSKKFKAHFEEWQNFLTGQGYTNTFKVLNSGLYGSAQNRERTIMVSILGEQTFDFEKLQQDDSHTLLDFTDCKSIHQSPPDYKKTPKGIVKKTLKPGEEGYSSFNSENHIIHITGKSPTLTATGANNRFKVNFEDGQKPRPLTTEQCWQLMGFSQKDYQSTTLYVSESQARKQAGNSIPVPLMQVVMEQVLLQVFNHSCNPSRRVQSLA